MIEVRVPNLDCEGCASKLKKALFKLKGTLCISSSFSVGFLGSSFIFWRLWVEFVDMGHCMATVV